VLTGQTRWLFVVLYCAGLRLDRGQGQKPPTTSTQAKPAPDLDTPHPIKDASRLTTKPERLDGLFRESSAYELGRNSPGRKLRITVT